jgi:hypothetical protein
MAGAVLADALSRRRRSAPFQQEHQTKISPDWPGFSYSYWCNRRWLVTGASRKLCRYHYKENLLDGLSSGCQKIDGGRRKEKPPPK